MRQHQDLNKCRSLMEDTARRRRPHLAQSGSAPVFGLKTSFRYDLVDPRRSLVGGVGYGLAFEGLIDELVGVSVHLAGNPGKSPSLEGLEGFLGFCV